MAAIGCRYPVFAVISSHTSGSAISYSTGEVLCHAIAANITYNRRDNALYGDDIKVETDKGLTDYTIAFEGDRLPNAKRAKLLGETAVTQTTTVTHYAVKDNTPPGVGFGYIKVVQEDNVVKYEAYWFHKVEFTLDNENASTKAEQISFGTYPITGHGLGVVLDSSGDVQFFDHMNFGTEAAAKTWLNGRAGIT